MVRILSRWTVFIVAGLVAVAACASASGQNWPSYRGPSGSGVGEGGSLPTSWDVESGKNVRFRVAIPGLGHSSPIVWGDRLFVTTAVSEAGVRAYDVNHGGIGMAGDESDVHEWRIYCIDTRDGKVLWHRAACKGKPRTGRHLRASHCNSTPVTDGERVVALMGSEGLFAFDMDGKPLWQTDLGTLDAGHARKSDSHWGHASSPILHDGRVIVQCDRRVDGFIAAFDAKTGKKLWQTARAEMPTWSTPLVFEGGGRTEIVTNGGVQIRGYDPATGAELWRMPAGEIQVKVPTPIVVGDAFLICGGYPRSQPMWAMRAGLKGEVAPGKEAFAWQTEGGSPYTLTPVAYGSRLFTCSDSGVLACYSATDGKEVFRGRLDGNYSASPVAGDGKIYFASQEGEVHVVSAGSAFELLGTVDMGESCMATPAISNGVLFVRGQSHLVAIEGPKG